MSYLIWWRRSKQSILITYLVKMLIYNNFQSLDVNDYPWWQVQLIGNLIFIDWHLKHITISLFEAIEASNETMVMKLQTLLDRSYGFRKKIIVYIKDDSSANLGPMTTTLKLVKNCKVGGAFQGTFLGMPHFWNFKTLKQTMTKANLILNLNKKQEHKKCKRKVQIDFYYEKKNETV